MRAQESVKSSGLQINCLVKGFIWSLLLTILLSLFISLLLQFTPVSEALLPGFSTFIFLISMLLGAVIGARAAGCLGLLHGLCIAVLYWLLLSAITLLWGLVPFDWPHLALRFVFALIAGAIGGIIGIGLAD